MDFVENQLVGMVEVPEAQGPRDREHHIITTVSVRSHGKGSNVGAGGGPSRD